MKVEQERLSKITELRKTAIESAVKAENALKAAKIAELQYTSELQQLYLEKRLPSTATLDLEKCTASTEQESVDLDANKVANIASLRGKAIEEANAADGILKNAKISDLEFKIELQKLYLENGWSPNTRLDLSTGEVTLDDATTDGVKWIDDDEPEGDDEP
jgi:hypothetical protein